MGKTDLSDWVFTAPNINCPGPFGCRPETDWMLGSETARQWVVFLDFYIDTVIYSTNVWRHYMVILTSFLHLNWWMIFVNKTAHGWRFYNIIISGGDNLIEWKFIFKSVTNCEFITVLWNPNDELTDPAGSWGRIVCTCAGWGWCRRGSSWRCTTSPSARWGRRRPACPRLWRRCRTAWAPSWWSHPSRSLPQYRFRLELQTKVREDFTITEKGWLA